MEKFDELISLAAQVRDATEEGENTAEKIGELFLSIIRENNESISLIKGAAMSLLDVSTATGKVAVKGTSLSGEKVTTVNIPAATTESAGVMSAADKSLLDNVIPARVIYNNDKNRNNARIEGDKIYINPNGFGVVINGKAYYAATTTSATDDYVFVGANATPFLVIDTTAFTTPNVRTELSDVVKLRSIGNKTATDIVIAYYYANIKKWVFAGNFVDTFAIPQQESAIAENATTIAKNTASIADNAAKISKIESTSYNVSIAGAGNEFVARELFLLKGHSYRLYIANPQWARDGITLGSNSYVVFQIKKILGEETELPVIVYKYNDSATAIKEYYDITVDEGVTFSIGLRANIGETVHIVMRDITEVENNGDILKLNPEIEVIPKMLAVTRAAKVGSTSQTSQLVLTHFSDIHGSTINYNRLCEFCKYYEEYIDDIIHTGDTLNSTFTSSIAFWTNEKILNCIGNHDTTTYNGSSYDLTGASAIDVYNKIFAPFIANWGVVQPEDAATTGKCYYYKDYVEKGVRLITLDCMRYDDAQHAWLAEALAAAKTADLHVLIAIHCPMPQGEAVNTTFHSLQDSVSSLVADARIAELVAASGVTFIAYLAGHRHWDSFRRVQGYENQICICIDSAELADHYNDSARIAGTKNQDCFNILGIDTHDKMLRLFRVGVDTDRWLRHKGCICWDYANSKMISQW